MLNGFLAVAVNDHGGESVFAFCLNTHGLPSFLEMLCTHLRELARSKNKDAQLGQIERIYRKFR